MRRVNAQLSLDSAATKEIPREAARPERSISRSYACIVFGVARHGTRSAILGSSRQQPLNFPLVDFSWFSPLTTVDQRAKNRKFTLRPKAGTLIIKFLAPQSRPQHQESLPPEPVVSAIGLRSNTRPPKATQGHTKRSKNARPRKAPPLNLKGAVIN